MNKVKSLSDPKKRLHPNYALCLNLECKYEAVAMSVARMVSGGYDFPATAYCPNCNGELDRDYKRVEAWRTKGRK